MINEQVLQKWSPELAYITGFFASDGCMWTDNKNKTVVSFYNTDKEQIEKIKKLLQSTTKIIKYQPNISYLAKGNKYIYRHDTSQHSFYNFLFNLGFTPKKSKTLQFPQKIPESYIFSFIKGYFDGDGCISHTYSKTAQKKYLYLSFVSGSQQFIEDASQFLNNNQIRTKVYYDKRSDTWFTRIQDIRSIYNFIQLIIYADNIKSLKWNKRVIKKLKFEKIARIEEISKKKTYDLTVQKNHNFILQNGILTHNCAKEQIHTIN